MIKLSYHKFYRELFLMINHRLSGVMVMLTASVLLLCGCGSQSSELTWELEESTTISIEENRQETAQTGEIQICIYICGAVENPGVYELPQGSRLYEAVELAGGMTKEADTAYLNLAGELTDGEQIIVPTLEETAGLQQGQSLTYPSQMQSSEAGLVNINTASVQELTSLSGIGESRALAIIAYRDTIGRFTSIEEIKNVTGIKEGLYEKIKDHITIG